MMSRGKGYWTVTHKCSLRSSIYISLAVQSKVFATLKQNKQFEYNQK